MRHLRVSQQIVGSNFIFNWPQIIFSSYHCTNHLLGGVECCPLLLGQGSVGRPAPKEPAHNLLPAEPPPLIYSCRVAKLFMSHSAFKTRLRDKDKRAKISKLVIDVNITAFGCQMLITWRKHCKTPFKKTHIKCFCENFRVLCSNGLH